MSTFNEDYIHVPMKDPKYCCVPSCKNNSRNSTSKSFFSLPKSTKQEWCNALNITCPKRVLFICEDHLNLREDLQNYQYWVTMKKQAILKPHLPQFLVKQTSSKHIAQEINEPQPSTSSTYPIQIDMQTKTTFSKGIQVKPKTADCATSCFIYKKNITSTFVEESIEDEMPSTQGSTNSAEISEVSSEICVKTTMQGRHFMLEIIKNKPLSYIGIPKTYFWLIPYLESKLKLNSLNIIVTLFKIRNNTAFYQISDMFEVSVTSLWRIFLNTLLVLSKFFKQFIFCPSIYEVKRNLPSMFTCNEEYSNVFCIIDCFEIQIEKPSNPVNQALTWSQYKNANTLKYLISTTPDGFVNFVSAGFGGRTSDALIVEKSGLLDVLPAGCTILADRGFKHIDTLLARKQIKLLRPPSVLKGMKLTKQEAIKSKVIASLRVHVERVIRRVRLFKFLKPHSVINNKLIQHADYVVVVACGLINLHSPIIKNM